MGSGDSTPKPRWGESAGARILLAGDDRERLDAVRRFVDDAQYKVTCIFDGQEALAEIRPSRSPLVLCAAELPSLDGYSLLRAVRTNSATRSQLFIIIGARIATLEDWFRAETLGLDACLDWPDSPAARRQWHYYLPRMLTAVAKRRLAGLGGRTNTFQVRLSERWHPGRQAQEPR